MMLDLKYTILIALIISTLYIHFSQKSNFFRTGLEKLVDFRPVRVGKSYEEIEREIRMAYLARLDQHISEKVGEMQVSKNLNVTQQNQEIKIMDEDETKESQLRAKIEQNAVDICQPLLGQPNQFNLIPLLSFPGSGNTWVRNLIEQATGYYTGSYYSDGKLAQYLKGELEDPDNLSTPVTKAHTIGRILSHERNHKNSSPRTTLTEKSILPKACIFIIRNPKNALLSQFARSIKHSHDLAITKTDLLPENHDFSHFDKKYNAFTKWAGLYQASTMDICNHNIMFIEYEKLLNNNLVNLVSILEKVVDFINENNDFIKDDFEPLKFRKNCLIVNNEGKFHRQHGEEKIEIDQYFSFEERVAANEKIVSLNASLAGYFAVPESYLFQ